jgi:hypothetical protein
MMLERPRLQVHGQRPIPGEGGFSCLPAQGGVQIWGRDATSAIAGHLQLLNRGSIGTPGVAHPGTPAGSPTPSRSGSALTGFWQPPQVSSLGSFQGVYWWDIVGVRTDPGFCPLKSAPEGGVLSSSYSLGFLWAPHGHLWGSPRRGCSNLLSMHLRTLVCRWCAALHGAGMLYAATSGPPHLKFEEDPNG